MRLSGLANHVNVNLSNVPSHKNSSVTVKSTMSPTVEVLSNFIPMIFFRTVSLDIITDTLAGSLPTLLLEIVTTGGITYPNPGLVTSTLYTSPFLIYASAVAPEPVSPVAVVIVTVGL